MNNTSGLQDSRHSKCHTAIGMNEQLIYKLYLCPGCWSHVVIAEKLQCSIWFVEKSSVLERIDRGVLYHEISPKCLRVLGAHCAPEVPSCCGEETG